MNLTINTNSSTWKNTKARYAIGVSGIALALSIAIAGISALPNSGSREAPVTPSIQNQPGTLFANAADAVFAAEGGVAVSPTFGSMTDAEEASVALSLAQPVSTSVESPSDYLGLGQPGERVNPQFANMADAEAASVALSQAQPVSTTVESRDAYLGLGQPGAEVAPQFANMADAADAAGH